MVAVRHVTDHTQLLSFPDHARVISFKHKGLGDSKMLLASESIRKLPRFEAISVRDNRLTDSGIASLIDAILALPVSKQAPRPMRAPARRLSTSATASALQEPAQSDEASKRSSLVVPETPRDNGEVRQSIASPAAFVQIMNASKSLISVLKRHRGLVSVDRPIVAVNLI